MSAHQECEYIMSDLDEENLFLYSNFVKLSGAFHLSELAIPTMVSVNVKGPFLT